MKRDSAESRAGAFGGLWTGAAAILLLVTLAYIPAYRAGYIWDDPDYLTENAAVQGGWSGLADIWTLRYNAAEQKLDAVTPQYYPLVFTSFWIEHNLWGLRPAGYHVINVLLHAANAILVWRIARRLRIPAAWLIGAIFAAHPMHVETVAWITERKNLLSGLFYLTAAWCYLRFTEAREPQAATMTGQQSGGDRVYYAASIFFFVAALLSKTVTATLPIVLLIMVAWRERRIPWRHALYTAPFFLIGIPFGLLTVHLEQADVGARGAEWALGLFERITILVPSTYAFYAAKVAWPHPLIFVYPRWDIDASAWTSYLPLLAVTAAFILAAMAIRRFGWGPLLLLVFSAVTLFPALGLFNVYPHRFSYVADHFNYLGSLGFIALYVVLGRWAVLRFTHRASPENIPTASAPPAARLLASFIIAALAVLTSRQSFIYRDAITLWETTLRDNPHAWSAMTNLGNEYAKQGRTADAIVMFERALAYPPARVDALGSWGNVLMFQLRRYDEAAEKFRLCLAEEAKHPWRTYSNLSLALRHAGKLDEAIAVAREGLSRIPSKSALWHNLAGFLLEKGELPEALAAARRAVELDAELPASRAQLGEALVRAGRCEEALPHLRFGAARLQHLETTVNLARCLAETRQYEEALRVCQQGVNQFKNAGPLLRPLLLQSAWLLSTAPEPRLRNGQTALKIAQQLEQTAAGTPTPDVLDVLAAAYAETGDFSQAAAAAERAAGLARAAHPEMSEAIEERLAAYRANRPWRLP